MKSITIATYNITPNCQKIHGGIESALDEVKRRALKNLEEVMKAECNEKEDLQVIFKVTRKQR